jgi:hypothetical protein
VELKPFNYLSNFAIIWNPIMSQFTPYQFMVVIYTLFRSFGSADFRKKSSFFQIPPVKKAMLRLSPTTLQARVALGIAHYR